MLNLSVLLEDSVRRHPSKTAYIFGESHFSYAQINGAACQVANGLAALGLGKGDKVALTCVNAPYFPIIYFGILKAGCAVVPLSVLLKKDEIAYHLSDSDAKAYFCFIGTPEIPMAKDGFAGFSATPSCDNFYVIMPKPTDESPFEGVPTFADFVKGQSPQFPTALTDGDDTAVIIYTSGTTGRPKGAELTHSNLLLNAVISGGLFGVTGDDVFITTLPMFHIFAMTVKMNVGLLKGVTNVLIPRFDPAAVILAIQKHQVTVFAGVPTMYWGLLNYKTNDFDVEEAMQSLRTCSSGGASLPVQVLRDFEARFNVKILEGYGMSEGSPVVTFNHLDRETKVGSVGQALWGVEVMVADENGVEVPVGEKGELLYRGHNVMKGYYKRTEATAETIKNGWLCSGDIAVMDSDRYFYIVDRTKDMVIRGGFNVYPREVEEVMIQHPAVSMVAVIGIPDEQYGEEIKACVVLKDGESVTASALIAWTKERLAMYKYPRHIEFMTSLPMNASGKILKTALRKQ
jgi:long-chain acyl-CoA synthetase